MADARHPGATRRHPGRLSRSAEFDRVYRHGRSVANRYLVLYTFPRQSGEPARIGLSVARRVGGAVERNQVKRLLREACAQRADTLPTGYDIVLVARAEAHGLASERGLEGIMAALEELLAKTSAGEGS